MNRFSKITIAIAITIMGGNTQAQEVNYGIQGGANFAVQSPLGAIYDNDDFNTGISTGVFANYSVTQKFGLQTEINYDQKDGSCC